MLVYISVFSQQTDKANKYYNSVVKEQSLIEVFPVEDIQSITVTNYNGTHLFTNNELIFLKRQLKEAKFAGGLLEKPGHIALSIKLKTGSKAKTGDVYAYEGTINFDGGIDKYGNTFSGTYYFPLSINFDSYK
jgi:hypothetical protein